MTVRKITSGEFLTYATEGNYRPDIYMPSSYMWGLMLEEKGINVIKLADRVVGNTAGILMDRRTYEAFIEKHGEVTLGKVLEASLAGELTLAYTNPYSSTAGLNGLTGMLYCFDPSDPLSDTAEQKLLEYQRQAPPVAYTTAVMRTQAARGIIKTMTMEEQAYVNTPELKDYVYTPAGIRHDHPVYTFDYVSSEKQEAAKLFVEYCLSDEAQKIADQKGFNLHDDYVEQSLGLDGAGYLAAQRIWKDNKDGGKPIVAVFVADVSGSMGEKGALESLKSSLLATSSYIGSGNRVGLVSYSDKVHINLKIDQFNEMQRACFSGAVNKLSHGGGTATYDAVLVALDMLREELQKVPDAKPMMFVLSDGASQSGFGLKDVSNIIAGMRVPIYTIGYNLEETGAVKKLSDMSDINEAALINASTDDIVNQLRNLFNAQL